MVVVIGPRGLGGMYWMCCATGCSTVDNDSAGIWMSYGGPYQKPTNS